MVSDYIKGVQQVCSVNVCIWFRSDHRHNVVIMQGWIVNNWRIHWNFLSLFQPKGDIYDSTTHSLSVPWLILLDTKLDWNLHSSDYVKINQLKVVSFLLCHLKFTYIGTKIQKRFSARLSRRNPNFLSKRNLFSVSLNHNVTGYHFHLILWM